MNTSSPPPAPPPPAGLEAQARRLYERARLWHAAAIIGPVALLTGLSYGCCNQPLVCLGLGLLLFGTATYFRWRGQTLGRAVKPGMWLGSLGFALPLSMQLSDHGCQTGACGMSCALPCLLLGLLLGAAVAYWAIANLHPEQPGKAGNLTAVGVIAGLTAALGCLPLGTVGVGALIASAFLSSTAAALLLPAPS